jgi:hypothetical protein
MSKLSTAAKVILDHIVETQGDVTFDQDAAKLIWGGTEQADIKSLKPMELLQYALISAHQQINELTDLIEEMVEAEQKAAEVASKMNREQRRKFMKGKSPSGLILPE